MVDMETMMREAGLNKYEAACYNTLLRGGVLTANDISKRASVPMGKIYETLSSLSSMGFIEVQNTRPMKYHPMKPKVAFRSFYERKRRERDKELELLKETISRIESASSVHKDHLHDEKLFWTTTMGSEDIMRSYRSSLAEAERDILIIVSERMREEERQSYREVIPYFMEFFREAVSRGVQVRIIDSHTGVKALIERMISEVEDEREKRKLSRFIEVRNLGSNHDFTLIDDVTTILDLGDPIMKGQIIATIKICDGGFNRRLRERFEEIWSRV
jgi:sugar-specific transcriptional regulator TrmB